MTHVFPKGFLWGAATSAYQIEGGNTNADWERVAPAGRAVDHCHRWQEDFAFLTHLKLNAYRMSVEWSRIEPREGEFDAKAIAFYREQLQWLKAHNITVVLTLFHFTLPQWLALRGGWAHKDSVMHFTRFAGYVARELGELVSLWTVLNEPANYAASTYLAAGWPIAKRNVWCFIKTIRHLIGGHKAACKEIKRVLPAALVGIAKLNSYFEAASSSLLDRVVVLVVRYLWGRSFIDAILSHLDFIGLNYYFHDRVGVSPPRSATGVTSDIGWEVYPEGIYHALKDLARYTIPIYVTENGVADSSDRLRGEYMRDHLRWLHRAIQEGVCVKGYFYWSLLDNYEWPHGSWAQDPFLPRFGLVAVDPETLTRTVRESARAYAEIASTNTLA